jgi:hypothetical protein
MRHFAMPFPNRPCGDTAVVTASVEIARDARQPCETCTVSDSNVIGYTHLAAYCHEISQYDASGNPNLTGNHAMASDSRVVADLNQIINFRPFTNHGIPERSAINSGIRADLDAILNQDTAKLRDFHMAI